MYSDTLPKEKLVWDTFEQLDTRIFILPGCVCWFFNLVKALGILKCVTQSFIVTECVLGSKNVLYLVYTKH